MKVVYRYGVPTSVLKKAGLASAHHSTKHVDTSKHFRTVFKLLMMVGGVRDNQSGTKKGNALCCDRNLVGDWDVPAAGSCFLKPKKGEKLPEKMATTTGPFQGQLTSSHL